MIDPGGQGKGGTMLLGCSRKSVPYHANNNALECFFQAFRGEALECALKSEVCGILTDGGPGESEWKGLNSRFLQPSTRGMLVDLSPL